MRYTNAAEWRQALAEAQTALAVEPDEESEDVKRLRALSEAELEDEVRRVTEEQGQDEFQMRAYRRSGGIIAKMQRQYDLKLAKHVMGEARFDRVVAPVESKWVQKLKDLGQAESAQGVLAL